MNSELVSQYAKAISHLAAVLRTALEDLDSKSPKVKQSGKDRIDWVATELEIGCGEKKRGE